MNIDPSTTKYLIKATISADGVIEKPDVVGAIFGQTEGLLGDELDLRDLQKSGRMGRIEVDVTSKKGKSEGTVCMPSSLDQVETSILASALETIDRVGPCRASINVKEIEDVRMSKRMAIVERAKALLSGIMQSSNTLGTTLTESVRQAVQVEEVVSFGEPNLPAGPNISTSDAIIIVEGRSDVLNLLKYGIKNAIAVEGTNVPEEIVDLSKERVTTAFVDGDRGGELILRELLQVAEVDFITRAPNTREVEELTQKQIMKALRNKIPSSQFIEMYDILPKGAVLATEAAMQSKPQMTGKRNGGREFGRQKGRAQKQPSKKTFREPRKERQQTAIQTPAKKPLFKKTPPPKKAPLELNEEQQRLAGVLKEVSDQNKMARIIDGVGKVISEVTVGNLADTLKNHEGSIDSVVFGGVISQRLLDIALEKGVKNLAGIKKFNITKFPEGINVYTKNELIGE